MSQSTTTILPFTLPATVSTITTSTTTTVTLVSTVALQVPLGQSDTTLSPPVDSVSPDPASTLSEPTVVSDSASMPAVSFGVLGGLSGEEVKQVVLNPNFAQWADQWTISVISNAGSEYPFQGGFHPILGYPESPEGDTIGM